MTLATTHTNLVRLSHLPSRLPSGQRASSACKALLCDLNWLGDGTDNTAYVSEWRLAVAVVLTEPTTNLDHPHSPFFFFAEVSSRAGPFCDGAFPI